MGDYGEKVKQINEEYFVRKKKEINIFIWFSPRVNSQNCFEIWKAGTENCHIQMAGDQLGKVGTYFQGIHGMRKFWLWGWSNLTYQNEKNTNLFCWIGSLHKIGKSSNHWQCSLFEEIYLKVWNQVELHQRIFASRFCFRRPVMKLLSQLYEGLIENQY